MKKYRIILLLLLAFGIAHWSQAQNTWESHLSNTTSQRFFANSPTADGGMVACGYIAINVPNQTDVLVRRVDAAGRLMWEKIYGGNDIEEARSIKVLSNGDMLIAGFTSSFGLGAKDLYLLRLDAIGRIKWQKSYGDTKWDQAYNIAVDESNDAIYLTGYQYNIFNNSYDAVVLKTNLDGNEIWHHTYGTNDTEAMRAIALDAAGNIIVAGIRENNIGVGNGLILKIDNNGNQIWEKILGGAAHDEFWDIQLDGNIICAVGNTQSYSDNNRAWLVRLNASGTQLNSFTFGGNTETFAYNIDIQYNTYYIAGSKKNNSNNQNNDNAWLLLTNATGQIQSQHSYGTPDNDVLHHVAIQKNNLFLSGFSSNTDGTSDGLLLKTDLEGNRLCSYIKGVLFYDINNNGVKDANEIVLANRSIIVKNNTNTQLTLTDDAGNYNISVSNGTYSLSVANAGNNWVTSAEFNALITQDYQTITVNIPLQASAICPEIDVDVATPSLKPCSTVRYNIYYQNRGTAPANDAVIHLESSAGLTILPSSLLSIFSLPENSDINPTVIQLGNIPIDGKGSFTIEVAVGCEVSDKKALWLKAVSTPNDICMPSAPEWSGASLQVTHKIVADSIEFQFFNVGDATPNPAVQAIVIEDQIILKMDTLDILPFDTSSIKIPLNGGHTYRAELQQANGHPGASFPTTTVEGTQSFGYYCAYPQDDEAVFTSIDYQETKLFSPISSLVAYPKGWGNEHYIEPNRSIEYYAYFKNNTNDTIFYLTMIDSITDKLAAQTLRAGASSHLYEDYLNDNGIFTVIAKNIQLAPNEIFFIKYRIAQATNLSYGNVVNNEVTFIANGHTFLYSNNTTHTINSLYESSITGIVLNALIAPVSGVNITDLQAFNNNCNSDNNGKFTLSGIKLGGMHTLKTSFDDKLNNGVDAMDLMLMSQHILGINSLNNPYQVLAADLNLNNSITAADAILLQRIILEDYQNLPKMQPWYVLDAKVAPKDFDYPNLPTRIHFQNLLRDTLIKLVAVKMGDLNYDANTQRLQNEAENRDKDIFPISIKMNQKRIQFIADADISMAAIQFALTWDAKIKPEGIQSAILKVNESNVGWHNLAQQYLTFCYATPNDIQIHKGDVLFELICSATVKDVGIITLPNILEAFIGNNNHTKIALSFNNTLVTENGNTNSTTFAFPNPIHDLVYVKVQPIDAQQTVISMLNQFGQMVAPLQIFSGENTIETHFDTNHLNNGCYFIQIASENNIETIKVFK